MYHIAVRQGWSQEFVTKYPHKDYKNKAPTESAFFGFGLKGVGSLILRKMLEIIQHVQLFSHYQHQRQVASARPFLSIFTRPPHVIASNDQRTSLSVLSLPPPSSRYNPIRRVALKA